MHKQLTNEQIESLYKFCVQHYVRQYDVQVELVDHLSNAIENIWQTNPSLSFDQAVQQVHASFGIKGFADIVAQKSNELDKQHKAARRKIFYQFFTWPKALFTIMVMLCLLMAPQVITIDILVPIISVLFVVLMFVELASVIKWQRTNKPSKELLLLSGTEIFSSGLSLPIQIIIVQNKLFTITLPAYYFIASLLLVASLIFHASYSYSKQVAAIAKQQYPLAFLK